MVQSARRPCYGQDGQQNLLSKATMLGSRGAAFLLAKQSECETNSLASNATLTPYPANVQNMVSS